MHNDEPAHQGTRPGRLDPKKDPRLEGLISGWKKGEKDKWRGHGKKDVKKKK